MLLFVSAERRPALSHGTERKGDASLRVRRSPPRSAAELTPPRGPPDVSAGRVRAARRPVGEAGGGKGDDVTGCRRGASAAAPPSGQPPPRPRATPPDSSP